MVADRLMAENSPSRQVTVVDVYDLASSIGKDFEKLIELFGPSSVTSLMSKVISSLELLETFANRNERENSEILNLNALIRRLELEKQEKFESRQKFEKELEHFEENYKAEIQQLWEMIQKLQEENKRLSSQMNACESSEPKTADSDIAHNMMMHLRETVDKQREQIKTLEKENEVKSADLEKIQLHADKLLRCNKELLRKSNAVQQQGRVLVEEKADLLSQIQDHEMLIEGLKQQLGETEKARKDLEETTVQQPATLDKENQPRFTLAELREVLQEKNFLKGKLIELEEELAQYRPSPTPSLPLEDTSNETEVLVYGPINREPEDKLHPWRTHAATKDSAGTGVRKFLKRIMRKHPSPSPDVVLDQATSVYRKESSACTISVSSSAIAIPALRYRPAMNSLASTSNSNSCTTTKDNAASVSFSSGTDAAKRDLRHCHSSDVPLSKR